MELISGCGFRYWHRSINPKKLVDVQFSSIHRNMTLQRMIRLYRLPDVSDDVIIFSDDVITRANTLYLAIVVYTFSLSFHSCYFPTLATLYIVAMAVFLSMMS